MKYTVSVESNLGQVIKDVQVNSEKEAISTAKKWSATTQDFVYISYFRSTDGQHGFINPDGAGITGKAWS